MNFKAWIIIILFLAWSFFSWNWINSQKNTCCNANTQVVQKVLPAPSLSFPLYFTLNSAEAKTGPGFKAMKDNQLAQMGPSDTLIIHAWYFGNEPSGDSLGQARAESIKALFSELDKNRIKVLLEKHAGNMDPSSEGFEAASFNTIHKKGSLIEKLNNKIRIYFPLNSSEKSLEPEVENYLDSLSEDMKSRLDLRVQINGYTDSLGDKIQNIKLSQKRADFVKKRLIIKGIDSSRIKSQGLGPDYPIADNRTLTGQSKNRRVELNLINP